MYDARARWGRRDVVRRLPLYASFAVATTALAFIAAARDWSAGELFVAWIIFAPLYAALVAVPWLLHENAPTGRPPRSIRLVIEVHSEGNGSPTILTSSPARTSAGNARQPATAVPWNSFS